MPIPFLLGAAALLAGAAGVTNGVKGAVKLKDANDTMQSADRRHQRNLQRFKEQNATTLRDTDDLGRLECEILNSFEEYSNTWDKVQGRPEFAQYEKHGVKIPKYDGEKLKEVSVGAGALLGAAGGAAAGALGGVAASGATTAAVMALGTASTGTAISALSGAAATNAALAVLGGGTLAAGGGGVALGSAVLGAATLGVGLLAAGLIVNVTGSSISDKADEAWRQMKRAEAEIDKSCAYMKELSSTANKYWHSLNKVKKIYQRHFDKLSYTVNDCGKTNWREFTAEEKQIAENTHLLVGALYNMCKVQLLLENNSEADISNINRSGIQDSINSTEEFIANIA